MLEKAQTNDSATEMGGAKAPSHPGLLTLRCATKVFLILAKNVLIKRSIIIEMWLACDRNVG